MSLSSSLGGAAGTAAASAVNNEVLGKCLKDKNGNPYTTCSRIFSVTMYGIIVVFAICVLFILALMFISPETFATDELPLIWGLIGGGTLLMIFLAQLIRHNFSGKYTLLPEGLKVETPSLKTIISYEDIKTWAETFPHVQYKFFYIMIINDRMIKFNYSSLVGCISFLTLLCLRCELPLPDVERMTQKVRSGAGTCTNEEKATYLALKRKLKQLK